MYQYGGMSNKREKTMVRIVVSDAIIVKRFIKDLKSVLKRSQVNGGGYSAFLYDTENKPILQVEIALAIRDIRK